MNKEELLIEALGLIAESDVSSDDYAMWERHLSMANEDVLNMFIQTTSAGGDVIKLATASLKAKLATEGDPEKFKDIIDTEKTEIKNILNAD